MGGTDNKKNFDQFPKKITLISRLISNNFGSH